MDIEQLPLCLDLFSHSGVTLSHEKYNLIMNSLVILQNENHFKKVYFWGQIYGIKQDYYIAFGYRKDALRGRLFYYSRNAITWVLLPIIPPKDNIHYLSCICPSRFYGNPPMKIDVLDEAPTEDKISDESTDIEEEEISDTNQLVNKTSINRGSKEAYTKRYSIEIFINMPNTRLSKQKEEERQKLLQADTMPVEMEEVLAKAGNGQIDLVDQGDNETFNVQNSASDSEVESLSQRSSMFDSSNDSIVPNNSETPLASPAKSDSLTILKEIKDHYKLKEEDRLSATVRYINQEAAIVPRAALFKQTNGHVVPNPAFQGLQPDESLVLSNYMHYRLPQEKWEVNVGRRPDYNYATDFLDTITEDIPRNNVWSVHVVHGTRAVILNNLYWPGFNFYHLLNSKIHGYIYMGFGRRNVDLPFMI